MASAEAAASSRQRGRQAGRRAGGRGPAGGVGGRADRHAGRYSTRTGCATAQMAVPGGGLASPTHMIHRSSSSPPRQECWLPCDTAPNPEAHHADDSGGCHATPTLGSTTQPLVAIEGLTTPMMALAANQMSMRGEKAADTFWVPSDWAAKRRTRMAMLMPTTAPVAAGVGGGGMKGVDPMRGGRMLKVTPCGSASAAGQLESSNSVRRAGTVLAEPLQPQRRLVGSPLLMLVWYMMPSIADTTEIAGVRMPSADREHNVG